MFGTLSEETKIYVLDLPADKGDYVWRGDLNILVLSSRLSEAEQERAIDEVQREWRRSVLRVVKDDDAAEDCPHVA